LQTRTQAEDVIFGPPFGDPGLALDQSQPGHDAVGQQPRAGEPFVVISGWQLYDNKGQVVEKYEPFFATGWDYAQATEDQLGQKAKLYYDPRGHVIRTVNPDGSEQRVIYGVPGTIAGPDLTNPDVFEPTPWEAYTYDTDDNAGRTHPTTSKRFEQAWNTSSSIVIDALGRTVEATERNRNHNADGSRSPVIEYKTTSDYDITGNLLKVTDALGRIAFTYTYDLTKRALSTVSVDAGTHTNVPDAASNVVEQRDAKGALILHSYDALNRPTRMWARDSIGGAVTLREKLIYGDDYASAGLKKPQAIAANLLGKRYKHYDEAGLLTFDTYDFKGNLLDKTRNVIAEAALLKPFNPPPTNWVITPFRVDWSATDSSFLDATNTYQTTTTYDALNRVKTMLYPRDVTAARNLLVARYNRAGALESVQMDGTIYLERIAYNARGQRILVSYGNGFITRYAHDPKTFRLLRMRTENYSLIPPGITYHPSSPSNPLQDFEYEYDLVGNILAIHDRAPDSGIQNTVPGVNALDRSFTYDAIYRLLSATGRECDAPPPPPPWSDKPRSTDITRVRPYTETYQYDDVGNMSTWKHTYPGSGGGFTGSIRQFTLTSGNNRISKLQIDSSTTYQYTYDPSGNMVQENTERHFEWDQSDRMRVFRVQPDGAQPSTYAQYLYDSGGQRVIKLVRTQGGAYDTTIYIDGVFERQRGVTGSATVENNLFHVMDNQRRIAIVRVGPPFSNDSTPAIKYQFGDHLGNSNVVVDGGGALINREEYLPYGETGFGSFARKRYRFTGKERDRESGLYYYGARYYAPWLVRWTTCDPARGRDLAQLYCFVSCNPLIMVDPSGSSSILASAFFAGLGNRAANALSSMGEAAILNTVTGGLYGLYQTGSSLSQAYREGGGGGSGVLNAVNSLNPVYTLLTKGWLSNEEAGQALFLESLGDMKGAQAHTTASGAAFADCVVGAVELGMTAAGGLKLARKLGVPGTSQPPGKPPSTVSKGELLKKITKIHNEAADRLASELQKTGVKAQHVGNQTIKDASGKSIKGTEGTATWRKPDVVTETDIGAKHTGIEVKMSQSAATVQKATDQLANEASFEGKGFFDEKPWTIGEGSGVVYLGPGGNPLEGGGLLNVFPAAVSHKN
jgi:RHS repeat-associated protein